MIEKMIWLSYPLDPTGPRPPAIPAPTLVDLYTVDRDDASVQTLTVASHTGTHLDTSAHIMNGGVFITDFTPESLVFHRPVVIDLKLQDKQTVLPSHLEPFTPLIKTADIVLFRFGYGDVRKNDPNRFSAGCPGFGKEAASWLLHCNDSLRAVGMDVPSFACIADLENTMAAHNVLLERPDCSFLILEEMNLKNDLAGLVEVRVNPWMVVGMHSGPCTIVGIIKTEGESNA